MNNFYGTTRRLGILLILVALLASATAGAQIVNWEGTNGIQGGIVTSIVRDAGRGRLFAAIYGGGVFHSTDDGATWSRIADGLSDYYITSLALDSSGVVLAGTEVAGIYMLEGNSLGWERVSDSLPFGRIVDMAVSSSGVWFASVLGEGIYKSSDKGKNWIHAQSGIIPKAIYALTAGPNGSVYAGLYSDGIYRTTDAGETWSKISVSFPKRQVNDIVLGSGGLVYAGTDGSGVQLSTDGGVTWAAVNTGLTNKRVTSLALLDGGNLVAATPSGIYRSDAPVTLWNPINGTGLVNVDMKTVAVGGGGVIYAGSNGSGVFATTDAGSTWHGLSAGLVGQEIRALHASPSGSIFTATNWYSSDPNSGIFKSTNNGETWAPSNGNITNAGIRAFITAPSGAVYAATYGGGIFSSTDDGATWSLLSSGLGGDLGAQVNVFARDSSGNVFAGSEGGVFRFDAATSSWLSINGDMLDSNVHALGANRQGTLFAGTLGGINRSTNGGASWTRVTSIASGGIFAITLDSKGDIFAGTFGGGVYRSTDNGDTWEPFNTGLTDTNIYAIAVTTFEGREYIAAGTGSRGVFLSAEGTGMWYGSGFGPDIQAITALDVSRGGYLLAGTRGGGVFRGLMYSLSVPVESESAPGALSLSAPFPNPASGHATIGYAHRLPGRVRIELFDGLGRKVADLLDGREEAGEHTIAIDATGLPGGVYQVRISLGTAQASRELVVVR
jgi:photosystem II stability/assembly factor-like uncharacterized protein